MKQAVLFALRCLTIVLIFVFAEMGSAVRTAGDSATGKAPLQHREWQIEGVAREALVYTPATARTVKTPVIFTFHGHGGTARFAAQQFDYEDAWPGAIIVYMQGLKTASLFDPAGTDTGWQSKAGDQNDRDLKFFDAVSASLHKEYSIDDKRVYATGHSNGGLFVYLLWAARGDTFAAMAASSAVAGRNLSSLKPKPAMHIAGTNDPLVPFRFQTRTMTAIRTLNGCEATGKAWAKDCTVYPSETGTPFVALIHPGDHKFPAGASALVVKFFQENARK